MNKKLIATTIAATLAFQSTLAVAAQSNNKQMDVLKASITEMYNENSVEVVNIDGKNYTYNYSYDSNENKKIEIKNDDNTTDVLVYNESDSTVYLNDKPLATIEKAPSMEARKCNATAAWPHWSASSSKVSWSKGTTVSVAAAAISIAIGSLGASGVITAIGSGALSIIASNSIGGTVYQDLDKFDSLIINKIKNTWSFTASTGQKFGPYVYVF